LDAFRFFHLVIAGRLFPTWSGMILQSIEKMAACFEADGRPGQAATVRFCWGVLFPAQSK
jgi:hypothetical protein